MTAPDRCHAPAVGGPCSRRKGHDGHHATIGAANLDEIDRFRAEVERLREALARADTRFEQICRDRRERDKVFAATTTARSEIARAFDETEAT